MKYAINEKKLINKCQPTDKMNKTKNKNVHHSMEKQYTIYQYNATKWNEMKINPSGKTNENMMAVKWIAHIWMDG